jgi:hypothetical protein
MKMRPRGTTRNTKTGITTARRNEKAGAGTISVKVETRDAHNCNKERKEGCRHNSKCRIEKAVTGTMTATRNEKETRGQNT